MFDNVKSVYINGKEVKSITLKEGGGTIYRKTEEYPRVILSFKPPIYYEVTCFIEGKKKFIFNKPAGTNRLECNIPFGEYTIKIRDVDNVPLYGRFEFTTSDQELIVLMKPPES